MPRASDTVEVESLPRNCTSVLASIVGVTDAPSGLTNAIRIRFCPSSTRSKRNLIASAHCAWVTGTSLALRRSKEPRMFNLPAASTVAASHNVKISTFIVHLQWRACRSRSYTCSSTELLMSNVHEMFENDSTSILSCSGPESFRGRIFSYCSSSIKLTDARSQNADQLFNRHALLFH